MTSTNASNPTAIALVLKPAPATATATLDRWLSAVEPRPRWLDLSPRHGVRQLVPLLRHPRHYPQVLAAIVSQLNAPTVVAWEDTAYEVVGIDVNRDPLHLLRLSFASETPGWLPSDRAIRDLCFRWFANTNPQLAATLQQVSPLPLTLGTYPARGGWKLNISLLRGELFAPLLWGMSAELGREIELDGMPVRLSSRVDRVASNCYTTIARQSPQNTLTLRFFSPTSFKQRDKIQPFPLPEFVFDSLRRRWNQFAPQSLHFSPVEWQGLVSAFDLTTKTRQFNGNPQIGCVGWVRYEFRDRHQAEIATTLAQFARFSGIGRKTAFGMGQAVLTDR